jgi:hypothetical protein
MSLKDPKSTLYDENDSPVGTVSNPLRTDPTGTTTQPVSFPIGVVDANNSSSTLLGSNASFTGTATDALNYASVAVLLNSDKASANNGVKIEFSNDGASWIDASLFTYTPGTAPNAGQAFVCGVRGRYFRVVYTNTNSAQGTFTLQTVLRTAPVSAEIVPAGFLPDDENYALLTKSIITGHTTAGGGSYVDVKVNPSGAVIVDGSGTTQPVSGTVTANQGGAPWSQNLTQINGNAVTTFAAGEQKVAVEGLAATGAAVSGNPVLAGGKDGSGNAQPIRMATDGTVRVDPTGTTTQPVSGTVTANQGGAPWSQNLTQVAGSSVTTQAAGELKIAAEGTSADNAALSGNPLRVGASDGTNIQTPRVFDVDSGGGTQFALGVSLRKAASGGSVEAATSTDPLRIDPTGTTTQPVSQGTAAAASGAWPVKVTDGTSVTDVKAASTAPVATDKALVVVISPNQQAIPVSSAAATATQGTIFGRVQYGASSGVITPVRATTYTEQTTNFTGSVKSSSASDTAAGTGARTITITYYDQTGAGPFTETATLNGTTAVNLSNTNHSFIEKIVVASVGSGGSNAGTITLFTGAGGTGTTVGTIAVATISSGVGDNTTFWAHHYVATGKTFSLYDITCSTNGNQVATFHITADSVLVANNVENIISGFITVPISGPISNRIVSNPVKVSGFSRITIYVVSSGTNTHFFGAFDYSEQ